MISPAALDRMRVTAARALPDTLTLERRASTSDGGGGHTETWANQGVGIACRISPVAGGERGSAGARLVDETTHVVTVEASLDVTEADRVIIADVTYEVLLVRRRDGWEITRRLEVKATP